jgi:hypothetical protein
MGDYLESVICYWNLVQKINLKGKSLIDQEEQNG